MKECPDCGYRCEDGAKYCPNCSRSFIGEVHHSGYSDKRSAPAPQKATKDFHYDFIDSDETIQATIGVSHIQSFMSGAGFKNGAAILTDKRLYYFGRSFSNVGRGMETATEEGIVSVDEITFTRFVHGAPVGQLVAAVLCFAVAFFSFIGNIGSVSDSAPIIGMMSGVLFLVSVVLFCLFFLGRSTVLEIAFPGGKYCFDAECHSLSSMKAFQKQIHLAKDRLKNGGNNKTGEKAEELQ